MQGVGKRMRLAMESSGFNETSLSLRLGINKRTFNNYLNDKNEPKLETLLDFCQITSTPIDQIVRKEDGAGTVPELRRVSDNDDLIKIDVIDAYLSAGPGAENPTENVIGQIAFQASWLDREGIKPADARIVRVTDDSMEPLIDENSLVMIDQRWREIDKKGIYAVRKGENCLIKEVEFRNVSISTGPEREDRIQYREWSLRSINPKVPTTYVSGAKLDVFEVLGKVVWVSKVWPHERY